MEHGMRFDEIGWKQTELGYVVYIQTAGILGSCTAYGGQSLQRGDCQTWPSGRGETLWRGRLVRRQQLVADHIAGIFTIGVIMRHDVIDLVVEVCFVQFPCALVRHLQVHIQTRARHTTVNETDETIHHHVRRRETYTHV